MFCNSKLWCLKIEWKIFVLKCLDLSFLSSQDTLCIAKHNRQVVNMSHCCTFYHSIVFNVTISYHHLMTLIPESLQEKSQYNTYCQYLIRLDVKYPCTLSLSEFSIMRCFLSGVMNATRPITLIAWSLLSRSPPSVVDIHGFVKTAIVR